MKKNVKAPDFLSVPNDTPTLEAACREIAPGGKIFLRPGTYRIPETLILRKGMEIRGNEKQPECVILEGGTSPLFHLEKGECRLVGLTLRNRGSKKENNSENAVLRISSRHTIVHSCVFESRFGGGLSITGPNSRSEIVSCLARNCGTFGFRIENGAKPRISNSTVSDCYGDCLEVTGPGTAPVVTHCRFKTSIHSGGIFVRDGARGIFSDCFISENALVGLEITDSGSAPVFLRCRFSASVKDLSENEILVCRGAAGTFIDCEAHRFEARGKGTAPSVKNCRFHGGKEGGIFVHRGACGIFHDCTVSDSFCSAMEISGRGSSPTVRNCRFLNSREGAGIFLRNGGGGKFTQCKTSGNAAGSVYFEGLTASVSFEKCRFSDLFPSEEQNG